MRWATFDPFDWSRIRWAVAEAVARLDPQDRARRVRWCQVTGEHGASVTVLPDGLLVFRWGGAELVRLPRDAFARYGATPTEMS
jgi:hypothetical protein